MYRTAVETPRTPQHRCSWVVRVSSHVIYARSQVFPQHMAVKAQAYMAATYRYSQNLGRARVSYIQPLVRFPSTKNINYFGTHFYIANAFVGRRCPSPLARFMFILVFFVFLHVIFHICQRFCQPYHSSIAGIA